MNSQKDSVINKRVVRKGVKNLRDGYAHLRRTRAKSPRWQAILDFAVAYPCHRVNAEKAANRGIGSPAILAAWADFAKARGVAAEKEPKA